MPGLISTSGTGKSSVSSASLLASVFPSWAEKRHELDHAAVIRNSCSSESGLPATDGIEQRVSTHIYNGFAQIDKLASALDKLRLESEIDTKS